MKDYIKNFCAHVGFDRSEITKAQTISELEQKLKELDKKNLELICVNQTLEQEIQERTREITIVSNGAVKSRASQRQFMAALSHEIRTPMHGILGLIEMLLTSDLNPLQREQVNVIRENSFGLLRRFADLSDLSKLDAGELALQTEPFNFRNMLEDICESLQHQAKSKGLSLELQNVPETRFNVIGDESRIQQILFNVISNSIEFSKKGNVTIRASIDSDSFADRSTFNISIINSSVNASEADISELFNESAHSDLNIRKEFGELGSGLKIAEKLIELMKGTLEVTNETAVGSLIEIGLTLPKHTSTEIHHPETASSRTMESLRPEPLSDLTIMVVDDNTVNRMLIIQFFKRLGINAISASDGQDAISIINKSSKIDLIFMDLVMPNMNGLEATARIRLSSKFQPIICGLSANSSTEDIRCCTEMGMNHFLAKPLSFSDFCKYLAKISNQLADGLAPQTVQIH